LGGGRLLTFDCDAERAREAGEHFQQAGLADRITQFVGDARVLLADVREPIDVLFLDGGFENYHACFQSCRARLRDGALLIADNAGIGAAEMKDYLDYVRTNYRSRTEWFETDLAWNPRDAMEISVVCGQ
jgi:predicted O-methyltransferase YrrM